MPLAEPWRIVFIIAHRPSFSLQAKTSMLTLGICTLLSIHIFFKRPFLHSSRHLETLLRTCTIENTDRLYENVSNSSKTIQLGSICLALVVTCSCTWSFSYIVWRHGLSGRRGKDSKNGRSSQVVSSGLFICQNIHDSLSQEAYNIWNVFLMWPAGKNQSSFCYNILV